MGDGNATKIFSGTLQLTVNVEGTTRLPKDSYQLVVSGRRVGMCNAAEWHVNRGGLPGFRRISLRDWSNASLPQHLKAIVDGENSTLTFVAERRDKELDVQVTKFHFEVRLHLFGLESPVPIGSGDFHLSIDGDEMIVRGYAIEKAGDDQEVILVEHDFGKIDAVFKKLTKAIEIQCVYVRGEVQDKTNER